MTHRPAGLRSQLGTTSSGADCYLESDLDAPSIRPATRRGTPRPGVSRADGQFANHPAPFKNDHWRAWHLSNYDGDTISVCVDVGFFDTTTRDVRLFGINAPELKTGSARSRKKGLAAKMFLANLLPPGTPIALVTTYDPNLDDPTEKYGRILAQVVKFNPDGSTTDVNAAMLASGLVVAYNPNPAPVPTPVARVITGDEQRALRRAADEKLRTRAQKYGRESAANLLKPSKRPTTKKRR